jgi:DNA-binding SARP family transcriptional activator
MTELRLALLGPPVVLRDGLPVTFDTRKAVALLALLAVTGREHSREQLADLLWPEADSAKGRASLRRTLSVTAAAMGAGLTISRAAVTLELAAVQVDVREFEALIARADAASLERAVQLYRDDFLSGFVLRMCPDFEEWQSSVAEGLRQALARGLQRLASRRVTWSAPPATPGAGCSSIRCTSPPIRRSSGCTAGPASVRRRCGSTGRWSGCWTGTWPFGRSRRRPGCTTT